MIIYPIAKRDVNNNILLMTTEYIGSDLNNIPGYWRLCLLCNIVNEANTFPGIRN